MTEELSDLNQNAVENTFADRYDSPDKTICAQSVLIYALRSARNLALRKSDRVLSGGEGGELTLMVFIQILPHKRAGNNVARPSFPGLSQWERLPLL